MYKSLHQAALGPNQPGQKKLKFSWWAAAAAADLDEKARQVQFVQVAEEVEALDQRCFRLMRLL
jgi:hypothetical protein